MNKNKLKILHRLDGIKEYIVIDENKLKESDLVEIEQMLAKVHDKLYRLWYNVAE